MPGPKKGWKQSLQQPEGGTSPVLAYEHRNNPDKLTGSDLRHLAHSLGLAKSDMATMSDDKIRHQLKFIAYRNRDAVE